MIISTKKGTPKDELEKIVDKFEKQGLDVTLITGKDYNVFGLSDEELKAAGIDCLPGSLKEAIEAAKADPFIKETLGDHVFNNYIEGKENEWDEYRTKVSQWEIDKYMVLY